MDVAASVATKLVRARIGGEDDRNLLSLSTRKLDPGVDENVRLTVVLDSPVRVKVVVAAGVAQRKRKLPSRGFFGSSRWRRAVTHPPSISAGPSAGGVTGRHRYVHQEVVAFAAQPRSISQIRPPSHVPWLSLPCRHRQYEFVRPIWDVGAPVWRVVGRPLRRAYRGSSFFAGHHSSSPEGLHKWRLGACPHGTRP